MKTKMFAIIAGLVLLSFTNVDAKPADEKKEASVSTFIKKAVKYPNFAEEQKVEGIVNLVVITNEKQELEIQQIWGSDPKLVEHVVNEFERNAKKSRSIAKSQSEPQFVRIKFNLV